MKIISSILFSGIFVCTACSNKSSLIESPQKNDIYIFEENTVYFPILVDSVAGEQIFCVNSDFKFVDAVPELEDLPKSDFDFSFHLIYEKAELKRLYESGSIIEIYRP
jgi:hypothetical protein